MSKIKDITMEETWEYKGYVIRMYGDRVLAIPKGTVCVQSPIEEDFEEALDFVKAEIDRLE